MKAAHSPVEVKRRTFLAHGRGVAERAVDIALSEGDRWRNPVIRLRYAQGLLRREDELRALRRSVIDELRSHGWTWAEIGQLMGVTRQRAHHIGTAESDIGASDVAALDHGPLDVGARRRGEVY